MSPSVHRVARRFLVSSDLGAEVHTEVRRFMNRALPVMKALYRRMHNAQKVDGKVFEDTVGGVVPGYDPATGGWGGWMAAEFQPYVGRVDFTPDQLPQVREMVRAAMGVVLGELFGVALGMSSSFRWDTETAEEFWIFNQGYDVRAAKRLIVARPRVVEALSLEGLKGLSGRTTGMNPDADSVDLRFPVLVATTPRGLLLPIDGWNRIRKAFREDLTEVPAVILNASETRKVSL